MYEERRKGLGSYGACELVGIVMDLVFKLSKKENENKKEECEEKR